MSQLFADLGLMPELTRAVDDTGYTQPTPVQVEAIPVILQGCDVLAGAQTGTGKTAGFTLPLLQRLIENPPEPGTCPVRALIVTPTRELAAQIEESVQEYGKYAPLRSTVVYGGVGMEPQVEALKAGVDILVATPGRLLDHANEQTVDLSQVEILVLDEADRMLDMGFIHDVKRILALLPAQRQNLLFSATFSDDIRALAGELLHDPVTVEVARRNAESELVAQRVHPVGQERKRALLTHLIKSGDWKQVLVFTRTKHGANRLAHQLGRSGISATAIHGNKGQGARTKALADFKAGLVRVLVATDLAARGLDIEELPHVVNYDMPQVAEDYVHRIGRTGRAGSTGEAISLVSPEEQPLLSEIEKLMARTVEQTVIPGFEPGSEPPPRHVPHHNQQQRQAQSADGAPTDPPQRGQNREGQEGREGRGRRRRGRNRRNGELRGDQRDTALAGAVGDSSGGVDGANGTNGTNGTNAAIALPQDAQRPQQGQNPARHPGQGQPRNGQQAQRQPHQPRDSREARDNRGNRAEPNHNRAHRHEALREDRDNRGNRDTSHRQRRPVNLDDDFGNRIPPVKQPRGIRARIAAGDIDEELDNIGNRMPPPPKHQRNFDSEEEINYNVALPEPQILSDEDDERQPDSNAGQMFPSSAGFMAVARPKRGNRGNRGNRGANNRNGNGNGSGNPGPNVNANRSVNHDGSGIMHLHGNGQGLNGADRNGNGNGNGRNRGNNKRRRGQQRGQQQGQPGGQQPGQQQRQGQPQRFGRQGQGGQGQQGQQQRHHPNQRRGNHGSGRQERPQQS